jgi:AmmeMemoRadiSam system protein A
MTTLTDGHRRILLTVAARAVHDSLVAGRVVLPATGEVDARLRESGATFVTLERDGDLLGCIGTLEPARPLVDDVAHNALGAAFADPRLPAVTAADYAHMSIKVSVLSRPERLPVENVEQLADVVRPGTDGLLLELGPGRSTLLPSVWPKVSGVAEFLDVLWRKAGAAPGIWLPGTRVSRYTTEEFGDPGPRAPLAGSPERRPARRA